MNVTELGDGTDGEASVVLHRHVTVVRPADAARHAWVLSSIGRIAEARGQTLESVVVRGEDLPSHDPAREVIASRHAEQTRHAAELDAVRRQREAGETALAAAVEANVAYQSARDAAVEALDRATTRRRAAVDEAIAAAAAVESARSLITSGGDPSTDLADARQRLTEAEAEADAADPDRDDSPLNRRLADLERHRVHLARRLAATGNSAAVEVERSLAEVLAGAEGAPPLVAALAMADTWRDLHQQIDALDLGVSDDERTAETELGLARRSLAEAEIAANQPLLTTEQIGKVEGAHSEVLDAQDRSEARFGGARARKRLDDLRSDERRVLERLGFSTYADYMMSSSTRDLSASRKTTEAARTSVLAAQEALDALPGASDRIRRRAELFERRDLVAPKIAALLGYEPAGPEAEDELRTLREPVADDHEHLLALAGALGAAGIDVGPGPHDGDDLLLLARVYLSEDRRAESERVDLAAAITAIDEAVKRLRAARDGGAVDDPDDAPLAPLAEPDGRDGHDEGNLREARWVAVEAARAAVAQAEVRLARQDGMSEEVSTLGEALDRASRRERDAADQVAAAEASLAAVREQGDADQAASAVSDAQSALARSRSLEAAAKAAVATLDGRGTEELQATSEAALKAAEGVVADGAATEQQATTDLRQAEATLESTIDAAETAEIIASDQDRDALVGDIDWALLSRLASIRSDHQADSAPLVLDEPFGFLLDDEVAGVLERLSRLAPLAQIIVVSNRPAVCEWATTAGPDRADVVIV